MILIISISFFSLSHPDLFLHCRLKTNISTRWVMWNKSAASVWFILALRHWAVLFSSSEKIFIWKSYGLSLLLNYFFVKIFHRCWRIYIVDIFTKMFSSLDLMLNRGIRIFVNWNDNYFNICNIYVINFSKVLQNDT